MGATAVFHLYRQSTPIDIRCGDRKDSAANDPCYAVMIALVRARTHRVYFPQAQTSHPTMALEMLTMARKQWLALSPALVRLELWVSSKRPCSQIKMVWCGATVQVLALIQVWYRGKIWRSHLYVNFIILMLAPLLLRNSHAHCLH